MSATYVLVTPAYNEARFIALAIESVLAQTLLPQRWVIVSDASTDGTDEIIARYIRAHRFISFRRMDTPHERDFANKVRAVNVGCTELRDVPHHYIGNLDADISLDSTYFEQLIERFTVNPTLGLAAGATWEDDAKALDPVRGEYVRTVAHAAQLMRRRCYEQLGGYPVLPYGGEDTYMEVSARMRGWQVETFSDLVIKHHRPTASADGVFRGRLRQGRMDRSLGYHPLFEIVKCARRLAEDPVLVGGIVRMAGYFSAWLRGDRCAVSEEFVHFLQREQMERLRELAGLGRESASSA